MQILLYSLICIILQELSPQGNQHSYKVLTSKGDTGVVFSIQKLNIGDTLKFK